MIVRLLCSGEKLYLVVSVAMPIPVFSGKISHQGVEIWSSTFFNALQAQVKHMAALHSQPKKSGAADGCKASGGSQQLHTRQGCTVISCQKWMLMQGK